MYAAFCDASHEGCLADKHLGENTSPPPLAMTIVALKVVLLWACLGSMGSERCSVKEERCHWVKYSSAVIFLVGEVIESVNVLAVWDPSRLPS